LLHVPAGGLIRSFEVLGLQQRSRLHLIVTLYYVVIQASQQCTAVLLLLAVQLRQHCTVILCILLYCM
jgi:hypothetical protein